MKYMLVNDKELSFKKNPAKPFEHLAFYNDKLFNGIRFFHNKADETITYYEYQQGNPNGLLLRKNREGEVELIASLRLGADNGYWLSSSSNGILFTVIDMGVVVESVMNDEKGIRTQYWTIEDHASEQEKQAWYMERDDQSNYTKQYYTEGWDIMPYYNLQNELRTRVVETDDLPDQIGCISNCRYAAIA